MFLVENYGQLNKNDCQQSRCPNGSGENFFYTLLKREINTFGCVPYRRQIFPKVIFYLRRLKNQSGK